MNPSAVAPKPVNDIRFLDEAGDTTFFGKGRVPALGQNGVSNTFAIGMVKINSDLDHARAAVRQLQADVAADRYLNTIPSVSKKIAGKGFYFHATDDPPEVRQLFYHLIDSMDCSCEVYVARKIPKLFARQHHSREADFYADVLSHLLKNKLQLDRNLVLCIAARGPSTKNANLQRALDIATARNARSRPNASVSTRMVFDVQDHLVEPLLNVADYMCWSVQRVFERGETRYYDFLGEKIKLVVDLYDTASYAHSSNYYGRTHRLTAANRISPPSP